MFFATTIVQGVNKGRMYDCVVYVVWWVENQGFLVHQYLHLSFPPVVEMSLKLWGM